MATATIGLTVYCGSGANRVEHSFSEVDPTQKVSEFRENVCAEFNAPRQSVLYKGKQFLANLAQLGSAGRDGVRDGDLLRLELRADAAAQAEARKQRKLSAFGQHAATRCQAKQNKEEVIDTVVQVQNQVGTLDNKVDTLVAAARGGTPVREPGQTDAQRLKQLRLANRTNHNEIQDLVEWETNRKATAKRDTLAGITSAAELADGSVACVNLGGVQCGDLTVEQLDEKAQEAKAVLKTIASRKRKMQADERAALRAVAPKAKAQPKAQPKAPRGRGRGGRSQPSSASVPGPSSASIRRYVEGGRTVEEFDVRSDYLSHHRPTEGDLIVLANCARVWQVQVAKPLAVAPVDDIEGQCPSSRKCRYCKKVAHGTKLFKLE